MSDKRLLRYSLNRDVYIKVIREQILKMDFLFFDKQDFRFLVTQNKKYPILRFDRLNSKINTHRYLDVCLALLQLSECYYACMLAITVRPL
jgi:hypothetical protein